MVMNAKKFCGLWHTLNETLLRGQTVSLHWSLEAGHRLWSAAEYVWLGCQLMTTHKQLFLCWWQVSALGKRAINEVRRFCRIRVVSLRTVFLNVLGNVKSKHFRQKLFICTQIWIPSTKKGFYSLKQQVDFLYLFHSFTWIKKFPFWCFMALSSGCSPLGSFLIVFRVFSFWKVYVIHVKKKVSLCAWNQTERQCRTLFFCFLTQDPLRRNSLFNLPLIFFFFFLVSARVSWREGGDGGGREEGWTSLSGSDHYGHQGNNGDQRMWLQSRLSFTFCSLPPLLHGQSRK